MADNETRIEELSEAAESSNPHPSDDPVSVLKNLVNNSSADEIKILKIISSSMKDYKKLTNHWITTRLRYDGYEAYTCTTEWKAISRKGESNTATNSFIQIVDIPENEEEHYEEESLMVDIQFKLQFNIPNASEMYKSVQNNLPTVFVGNNEKLIKIIQLISKVAQASMAAEDIPPFISADKMFSRWLLTNVVMRK